MLCMHLPMVNYIVCEKIRLEVDLNADKKRFWLGTLSAINHDLNDSANFAKSLYNLKHGLGDQDKFLHNEYMLILLFILIESK